MDIHADTQSTRFRNRSNSASVVQINGAAYQGATDCRQKKDTAALVSRSYAEENTCIQKTQQVRRQGHFLPVPVAHRSGKCAIHIPIALIGFTHIIGPPTQTWEKDRGSGGGTNTTHATRLARSETTVEGKGAKILGARQRGRAPRFDRTQYYTK